MSERKLEAIREQAERKLKNDEIKKKKNLSLVYFNGQGIYN